MGFVLQIKQHFTVIINNQQDFYGQLKTHYNYKLNIIICPREQPGTYMVFQWHFEYQRWHNNSSPSIQSFKDGQQFNGINDLHQWM